MRREQIIMNTIMKMWDSMAGKSAYKIHGSIITECYSKSIPVNR